MPFKKAMRKKPEMMRETRMKRKARPPSSVNRVHKRMKVRRTPRGRVRLNVAIW